MTQATLNEQQIKREAHLDLVLKDLKKVEVIRCLASNLTSTDLHPGAPAPSTDCPICVHSTLCRAVRKELAKL